MSFMSRKVYAIMKSAEGDGDADAKKILTDQANGMSQEELDKEISAFFRKSKLSGEKKETTLGAEMEKAKKLSKNELELRTIADIDAWQQKDLEEYRKSFNALFSDEKKVQEYLDTNQRHTDDCARKLGKSTPTISQKEIDDAVNFFKENPNFDVTGIVGNKDQIKKERECLIIIGPAGSGKTSFVRKDKYWNNFAQSAVSIDPDKYRNADPNYSGYSNKTDKSESDTLWQKYGLDPKNGKELEGHDYTWSSATQPTQKAILGKYDNPDSMFGEVVATGSNFIYQTVGDDPKKIIEMINGLKVKGYKKINLLHNELSEGLERLAANSVSRFNDGQGRMVPINVTMDGLRSSETFYKCYKKFKNTPGVSLMMNTVYGKDYDAQKNFSKGSEVKKYHGNRK